MARVLTVCVGEREGEKRRPAGEVRPKAGRGAAKANDTIEVTG